MWTLYSNEGPVRNRLGRDEARDLVIMDANRYGAYAIDDEEDPSSDPPIPPTGETIRWDDVRGEPWPGSEEVGGYGPAPEDWPYGN